jgi:hypothetical protein
VNTCTAFLNGPLVVTQFIETIELLHVQGPKRNILAVGDYPRADRLSKGENDYFYSVQNF